MIKNRWLFIGILSMALVFSMVFMACPASTTEEEPDVLSTTVAKPVITAQSGTKRYLTTSTNITALSVTATASDSGVLEYQWYSRAGFGNTGGAPITGETSATYTPSIAGGGTTYYYVVVTNPATAELAKAETASNPIGIIVLTELPDIDATVTITDTQAQYVRGFGGMSNAFGIEGTPGARYIQMQDIETMFGPGGLGFKILRIIIFPNPLDQVISGMVEPQMGNAGTYINVVKKVNEYGGYVLASPWTPPANYKTNDALTAGGHLRTNMYLDYALYLRNFASSMANYGAPIYAISIQNEPSLVVGYHGMEWSESEHRNFLRDHGDRISRNPTAIKGWGGGVEQPYVKVVSGEPHNAGGWYNDAMDLVIGNATAHANLDLAAYHIYGGSGNRNSISRNGTLNRETWMTEYNINSGAGNYAQDSTWDFVWPFTATIHHVIGNNDSSGFVWWYIKRFYGAIGDGSEGTVNGAVMPRGYTLSHYAKYATDTLRVDATTTHPQFSAGNVSLTAFQRKKTADKTTPKELQVMADEDSYSLVIYDQRVSSSGQRTSLRVSLPAGFVASAVTGIISDSSGNRHAPVNVELNPDGDSADVTLPANAIISLKFVK